MGEASSIGSCLSRRKIVIFTAIVTGCVLFLIVRDRYFYRSDFLKPLTSKLNELQKNVKTKWYTHIGLNGKKEIIVQRNVWDIWTEQNRHVTSIGDIYNKCNNNTRTKIGKVVLEEDKKNGGVHITSYMNCSHDHEIKSSTAHLTVYYNGEIFYEKDYDMCKAALKLDTPYSCPIPKGKLVIVRDVATMPGYIPKGSYKIFAYVKDQNKAEIGCTFAEFKTGEKLTN